jgi:YfiH family protein
VSNEGLLPFRWELPPGVFAAFTTRRGGSSAAPWDSFNLGVHVGDAPAAVAANRARVRDLLMLPVEPSWLEQVHGVDVADLDGPARSTPVKADAAIATEKGRVCAIMVADCLPVLFASRDGTRIGAAHAGWRGLAAGVLEHTVAALGVPGSALTAWLGPAISRAHFEVGDDVRAAFVGDDAGAAQFFAPNAHGKWLADLVGLARRRLASLGITSIWGGEWCTFADPEQFFSHRRDGQKMGSSGRMAALIWRAEA